MNKLIKINESHYVICDDSEIKSSDWVYSLKDKWIKQCVNPIPGLELTLLCKKITHSTQPLDEVNGMKAFIVGGIELLEISEVEEVIYGYNVLDLVTSQPFTLEQVKGYIEGFNTHKELVKDKLFTIEDMKKCWENGNKYHKGSLIEASQFTFDKTIQSLLPTEWNIKIQEDKIKLL